MDLVEEVYRLTQKLPKEETYGLVSQLRRAAVSVVANIAEGFGRYTYADKAHKYRISRGEATEIDALLHITVRLKMLSQEETQKAFTLVNSTGRLLSGLIKSCEERKP